MDLSRHALLDRNLQLIFGHLAISLVLMLSSAPGERCFPLSRLSVTKTTGGNW